MTTPCPPSGVNRKATPVERKFDKAGRLTDVIDFDLKKTTFTYDDYGNWATSAFPGTSGTVNTDTYAYDAAGRMTEAVWRQGTTQLGKETYTRPTATKGMVDTVTPEGAAGTAGANHEYDTRDRLIDTAGTTTAANQQFRLDEASNLTKGPGERNQQFNAAQELCWSSAIASVTTPPPAACPATSAADAETYTTDALGRRATTTFEDQQTRGHTYDQANRLANVTDTTGAPPAGAGLAAMDGTALVGNFDGDTEDDVFFYRSTSTANDDWVWWGADRDQFGSVADTFSVGSGYTPVTGDFNCDSRDDIMWYKPGSGNDYVWFWFGRYDTSSEGDYTSKAFTIAASFNPVTGDFDGDSCSDILWYAAGSATDAIWWGDADVAIGTNQFDLGAATVGGTFIPVAGDFDGNDADDVFWYAPGTDQDYLWMFDSTGGAYASTPRTVNTTTYELASGDINGDARDDLLFYNTSGTDNLWWGRSDATTFGSSNQKALPAIDDLHDPVIGDFDGDSREDLFLYRKTATGDTIWWGASDADFATTTGGIGFQNTTATHQTNYTYDTDGVRASKTVDAGTAQKYTYSNGTGLPLLLAEAKATQRTYLIYGPGNQPIEQINPDGTKLWLHHDQLGSVRLATKATDGATHSRRSYHPYGTTAAQATASPDGKQPLLGYAGQYTDTETGYQYLRARYYDPATGQFLSVDPAMRETHEPYGYAGGNPAAQVDPTGLDWYNPTTWDIPDCPFGKNPDGGCRGKDLTTNPIVQTVVVAAACTNPATCVIANSAVVLINAEDRWDYDKGWGNLTDPEFMVGTAIDVGFTFVHVKFAKNATGTVGRVDELGGVRMWSPKTLQHGGQMPLSMRARDYYLPGAMSNVGAGFLNWVAQEGLALCL